MKNYGLFIGIDISKKTIDAALTTDGDKARMNHCKFDNNLKGFKKLIAWIKRYATNNRVDSDWLFCMEHTGVYTFALCVFLEERGLDYSMESALQIKRSSGIKRGKDDKSDSKDIVKYAFTHYKDLKINNLPSKTLMQLKSLLSFRERLVKQKVMLQASSKEFNQCMPQAFKVELITTDSADCIKVLKAKIKMVEKAIRQIIKDDDELNRLYELVVSVKGIGLVIAATMIVHTNAFKAFKNARKFACYIAIVPFGETSGTCLNKDPKVSKLGYTKIKALFSNACCSAIQHDKQLKAYFKRKIAEGKSEGCVYNAIKNKLVARIFAVVKRGTPFVELNY